MIKNSLYRRLRIHENTTFIHKKDNKLLPLSPCHNTSVKIRLSKPSNSKNNKFYSKVTETKLTTFMQPAGRGKFNCSTRPFHWLKKQFKTLLPNMVNVLVIKFGQLSD